MITRDTFRSLLGEGFHTAFRKAVDTAAAATIHRLIADMPPEEWAEVVDFVTSGFPDDLFEPARPNASNPSPDELTHAVLTLSEFVRQQPQVPAPVASAMSVVCFTAAGIVEAQA